MEFAALVPAFSPDISTGSLGRLVTLSAKDSERGIQRVVFPKSCLETLVGNTIHITLPPWGDRDDATVLASLAQKCVDHGARAVILRLPDRYNFFGLFDRRWGHSKIRGADWKLQDWAQHLSSDVDKALFVEIPVLLVQKELEAIWQNQVVSICSPPDPHSVLQFVDGRQCGALLLSQLLHVILKRGDMTEARLGDVCEELRTQTWSAGRAAEFKDATKTLLSHSTPSNVTFVLQLSLVLQGHGRLQERFHSQELEQLQLQLLTRHVLSYAFAQETPKLRNTQVKSSLRDALDSLARDRTLCGHPFPWTELLPILALRMRCGLGAREETLRRMCTVPCGSTLKLALESLGGACATAMQHGVQLEPEDMAVIVHSYADAVCSVDELIHLLAFAEDSRRVSLASRVLNRLAAACQFPNQLETLTRQVSARLEEWETTSFAAEVGNRVLQFLPCEVLRWLKSPSFEIVRAPSAEQLIREISRPTDLTHKYLASRLQIVDHVRTNMDSNGLLSFALVIKDLLTVHCAHDVQSCSQLIRELGEPLFKESEHAEIALAILPKALATHFQLDEWSASKSDFCEQICSALSQHGTLTTSLSAAVDVAINALIGKESHIGRAPGLLAAVSRAQTSMAVTFWARWAVRTGRRTKALSHFSSIASLLAVLPSWSAGNPKQGFFCEYLRCLTALARKSSIREKDEATGLAMEELTEALRASARDLLRPQALGDTSHAHLLQLRHRLDTLKAIESALYGVPVGGSVWEAGIVDHLKKWQDAHQELQSEHCFLDALQRDVSGVPMLVAELERETAFRASREEAMTIGSSLMLARAKTVRDWLRTLGRSDRPSEARRFFEHFVVHSPSGAASKSVLFRYFLRREQESQPTEEFEDTLAFASSLHAVMVHLRRFLKEDLGNVLSFNEVMEIGTALKDAGRSPKAELGLLCPFYLPKERSSLDSVVEQQLITVTQLGCLRQPLTAMLLETRTPGGEKLPGVLECYGFQCASTSDLQYTALKETVTSLCDPQQTCGWDGTECKRRLDLAHSLLTGSKARSTSHEVLLGMLYLFEHFASASRLWEFMHSHKQAFIASGGGCNAEFSAKVEDLLEQLGGEDYKILESFKPVAWWVSVLVAHIDKPFAELMRALWSSDEIVREAKQGLEHGPFSQLAVADGQMDVVSSLFLEGLGGLDSVLPQFECVEACSIFIFDLETARLSLVYADERRKAWVALSSDQMMDFEQRLGFVKREDKARTYEITPFLEKVQEYRISLALMAELHTLGHGDFVAVACTLARGATPPWGQRSVPKPAHNVPKSEGEVVPAVLRKALDEWKYRLKGIVESNALLCLFSNAIAQRLSELVISRSSCELAMLISPLFAVDYDGWGPLIQAAADVASQLPSVLAWPERTSAFLDAIVRGMKTQGVTTVLEDTIACPPAETGVGPVRYTASGATHLVLMSLVLHIFGRRAPAPFEVLWCDHATTLGTLNAFLERANHHPRRRFVLLQVDRIAQSSQNALLRLFLDSRTALAGRERRGHNICCIETGPCALQSASWVKAVDATEVFDDGDDVVAWLRNHADTCGIQVTCYHGPPGSGKTHLMRKHLEKLRDHTVVALSITEAFSPRDSARKLHEAALRAHGEPNGRPLALSIQLNLGKFRTSERVHWCELMQCISKFFFHLLVLRSVEDPASGTVFSMPPGSKVQLLVELPDRDAHLEPLPADATLDASERQARDLRMWADELPGLAALASFVNAADAPFEVTDEARHVCKYLKAYDTPAGQPGSIDQLYGGADASAEKDVVFVLDNSGSMGGQPLETCKQAMLHTILPHCLSERDGVGLIVFDHEINVHFSIEQLSDAHRTRLSTTLADVKSRGGTELWSAMSTAICMLDASRAGCKWLVALTDGASADAPYHVHAQLRSPAGQHIRVLFITVNLQASYEHIIRSTCMRENGDEVIPANGGMSALQAAWRTVGARLTVSQTILRHGASISPADCVALLRKYMKLDSEHRNWSRLKQTHWIRYLFRRCAILAASEKFDKNETLARFGSTTMRIMLGEVEHFLSEDYQIDWHSVNHEQLVYRKREVMLDGQLAVDYEWSVLATNPGSSNKAWKERLDLLRALKMQVPTKADLARSDRRVLDAYLANGLGIELHAQRDELSSNHSPFDFPLGSLPIINEHGFVMTVDFVMKLLCMNERIECGVPCIVEGETGVSKTELTRMLFVLKNTVSREPSHLEQQVTAGATGSEAERPLSALRTLADFWGVGDTLQNDEAVWRSVDDLALHICLSNCVQIAGSLLDELRADPALDPLVEMEESQRALILETCLQDATAAAKLLTWYVTTRIGRMGSSRELDWTFFPVDVHAALTPHNIGAHGPSAVYKVVARAERLQLLARLLDSERHRKTTLCLFFDEFNTSSCMGVFKELLVDHSFDGKPLPRNVVIVAASNPSREKIQMNADARLDEQGQQWAIGHYQVHPVPESIRQVMWDYGSLTPALELEFIDKRLRLLQAHEKLSDGEVQMLAKLVHASQQETRALARAHIADCMRLERKVNGVSETWSSRDDAAIDADVVAQVGSLRDTVRVDWVKVSENLPSRTPEQVRQRFDALRELDKRANSAVSLRDILRTFKLFAFFNQCTGPMAEVFMHGVKGRAGARRHRALLLALGMVYYLRLGSNSADVDQDYRRIFRNRLKNWCGRQDADVESALDKAMGALVQQTMLEPGIATTRGLQENIFMVIVCVIAQVPLMIVGPPGSSKTLAVTIVAANARGQYSDTEFYKAAPQVISWRYQCSRRSTSTEIQAVFEAAIERQHNADKRAVGPGLRCFVFMDEAGLPEEERESLKVLHYYLENHKEVAARVGFVAITNHLLDTAKVNRCATLTRSKPDHTELMFVARDCLGTKAERGRLVSSVPGLYPSGQPRPALPLDSPDGGLLEQLCETYSACMGGEPAMLAKIGPPPAEFATMFGLRDVIHFFKLLRRLALADATSPTITRDKIVHSLERNMNGVESSRLRELLDYFMAPYDRAAIVHSSAEAKRRPPRILRNPLDLMLASLREPSSTTEPPLSRYKLVVDTTIDDSILRALGRMLGASTVKLSHFAEDSLTQQINAISAVKWAAEQGELVVLSQTESINESFYDLFNQHFRKYEDKRSGTITFHANVAVGAHSRRCRVSPGFQCIVHLTLSQLQTAPAPFLNRFEKYRLTHADLLESHLRQASVLNECPLLGELLRSEKLFEHVQDLVMRLGVRSFYGLASDQTVESALLCLLSRWESGADLVSSIEDRCSETSFCAAVEAELASEPGALAAVRCVWADPSAFVSDLLLAPDEASRAAGLALLAQFVLHDLVVQLIGVVVPEHLFKCPASLPTSLLQSYLQQQPEHFGLAGLLKKIRSSTSCHMIYTRTCAAVLGLRSDAARAAAMEGDVAGLTTCVSVQDFFLFSREPQFIKALEDFLHPAEPNDVLLLLIDASQTDMGQVNFARQKIEELLHLHGATEKKIALLMHLPPSDLLVQPVYDTTFCRTWTTTFLDSVDDEGTAAWLELSCGLRTRVSAMLAAQLEKWLPDVVRGIAPLIELPACTLELPVVEQRASRSLVHRAGVLGKRIALLELLLEVRLNGASIQSILLRRYHDLWAGEDGSFTLLREQVKKKIAALAAGELQMSLAEALTGEVRHMFAHAMMSWMCMSLNELNAHVLLDCPASLQQMAADCFCELRLPPMAELAGDLRSVRTHVSREPPDRSMMVPFFSQLHRIFDKASSQALLAEQTDEDALSDAGLQRLAAAVEDKLSNGTDGMSAVATQLVGHCVAEALWQRYLGHFLSHHFPYATTAGPLIQHQVIGAWLTAKIAEVQRQGGEAPSGPPSPAGKIACLHVVHRLEHIRELLAALASSIAPLAALVPSDDISERIIEVVDSGLQVQRRLSVAIVQTFYTLMRKFISSELTTTALRGWANAFESTIDRLPPAVEGVDYGQLEVMRVVLAVTRSFAVAPAELRDLASKLHAIVSAEGATSLGPAETWEALPSLLTANAALCYRLADRWLHLASTCAEVIPWMMGTILSCPSLSVPQLVSLLERLLFGEEPSKLLALLKAVGSGDLPSSPLVWWLENSKGHANGVSSEVLEERLKVEAQLRPQNRGLPPWFHEGVGATDPAHDQPLTKAYIALAWKWLLILHRKDSMSELALLAHQLQSSRTLRGHEMQRGLAVSAVRVRLLEQLAERILMRHKGPLLRNGEEADRCMSQLELMDADSARAHNSDGGAPSPWIGELALAICRKVKTAAHGAKLLLTRADREESTNYEVARWLREAAEVANGKEAMDPNVLQARRQPLVHVPLVHLLGEGIRYPCEVAGSDIEERKRFVSAIIRHRTRLRLLWVIPDVLEFYRFISNEVSDTPSPNPESTYMATKVGAALLRMAALERATYYRKMWVRVKVGVNMFLRMVPEGVSTTPLDENMSFWSLLSTPRGCSSGRDLPADCLYQPLAQMLHILNDFMAEAAADAPHITPEGCMRPTSLEEESTAHFLDDLSEMDVCRLQERVAIACPYDEAAALEEEVRIRYEHLDDIGALANAASGSCSWSLVGSATTEARHTFDLAVVGARFAHLQGALRRYAAPERYRRVCRFSDAVTGPAAFDASSYHVSFHSLGYGHLRELRGALLPLMEFAEANGHEGTVRELLMDMYPGAAEEDYLSRAYVNLEEDEQRRDLLGTPATELRRLCDFLERQLQTEAYRFAREKWELKSVWPPEVDEALAQFKQERQNLAAEASALQACLIRYKRLVAGPVDKPTQHAQRAIVKSLTLCFPSEEALFREVPLLRELQRVAARTEPQFAFLGTHYVQLRLLLADWSKPLPVEAPVVPWTWPFYLTHGAMGVPVPEDGELLRARMTPWFFIDSPEERAVREERDDEQRKQALQGAKEEERADDELIGQVHQLQSTSSEATTSAPHQEYGDLVGSPRKKQARKRKSSKRGRSTARGGSSLGALLQADATEILRQQSARDGAKKRLSQLCNPQLPLAESLIDEIDDALRTAKASGVVDGEEELLKAAHLRREVQGKREQALEKLERANAARPLDDSALKGCLARAREVGLSEALPQIEAATRTVRQACKAREALQVGLEEPFPLVGSLRTAMQAARDLQLVEPKLAQAERLLRELRDEELYFEAEARRRWGVSASAQLVASVASWRTSISSSELPQGRTALVAAEEVLANLAQAKRKSVDAAKRALEAQPLRKWAHATAYLAAANASDPLYRDDAVEDLEEYAQRVADVESEPGVFVLAFLLAAARLCAPAEAQFRRACLRRCNVHETRALLSQDEQRTAKGPIGAAAQAPEDASGRPAETPASRWDRIKGEVGSPACPSLDKLMALIGLQAVKMQAVELYLRVRSEQRLPPTRRVPQSVHFALLGNPGTGKTTVARLLGGMLCELGVRARDVLVDTTGEELSRQGADKVSKLIDSAMGGVLFIDEAYGLEPVAGGEGAAVALQLLDVAEKRRTELTIILAGYKDDMERKLFEFNDGFIRRINYQFHFEDFTERELADVFRAQCDEYGWTAAEGEDVVGVAARRLARGRGRRGFGNAGEARMLFERAYSRALGRDTPTKALRIVDVIGPPPDPAHVPELCDALDELNDMVGLDSVKASIHQIVQLARTNYERELDSKPPHPLALNRVFLGNPGTGKTTVAKLYGRILKAAGLLSDGTSELKQPSDLTGSHVGETERRTAALIRRCAGRVLVVDEAYALNESSYGHVALSTLVGLVHGAPGEDIAVVLIGYENQMLKMFREANEGLPRRFGLQDAFRFDDFDDCALDRILLSCVQKARLQAPRAVRARVVKALAAQRGPGFGNAGDVVGAVARAKQRLSARDPEASTLTIADFCLDRNDGDGMSALSALYKVEHIRDQLIELKATLVQLERDGKERSDHLESYVFVGNPGTGKTTVARVMARVLHEVGILSRPEVKAVSGLDLQGSYLGQTKDRVNEAMADARGGVLLIDEAYAIGGGHHYSKEAVDQLVAVMTTPEHFHKTVVILAGYYEPMERMLSSNQGLRSRFTGRIEFPDWDADDCVAAIRSKCEADGIALTDGAARVLTAGLREIQSRPGWANARDSLTAYLSMYKARAQRLRGSEEADTFFLEEDAIAAMSSLRKSRPQRDVHDVVDFAAGPLVAVACGADDGPLAVQDVQAAPLAPKEEEEEWLELRRDACEECTEDAARIDPVYAALLQACVAAGFDTSHDRRKELIALLEAVQSGASFPGEILDRVLHQTPMSEAKAHALLRPQVHYVMDAMRGAVREEEALREELCRLVEEERLEELRLKQEEYRRAQEALQQCRACPMGYSWYCCGSGWRCTGGSHHMSDGQLRNWNTA